MNIYLLNKGQRRSSSIVVLHLSVNEGFFNKHQRIEGDIKNGQSRDTGDIWHNTQNENNVRYDSNLKVIIR